MADDDRERPKAEKPAVETGGRNDAELLRTLMQRLLKRRGERTS